MDNGLRAASCFSGIGAPELGGPQFTWLWHAEIEKFPAAVMEARFPDSTNLGDVTADDFLQRASSFGRLDLLVGGPPCQDFSVAGLRAGVAGDRGNLSLRFMEIAHAIRPRNLLVENVPGWLNMPDNAFGCFLGALVGADDALRSPLDGKWPSAGMVAGPRARAAWRVFDAQYFGVAQRRRRVFVVADFGDGADPAAVLFERKGVSGNTPPRRETGQGTAGTISARAQGGGGFGTDFDLAGGLQPVGFRGGNCSGPIDKAACLTAKGQRIDFEVETFIAGVAGTLPAGANRTGGDRPPGMGQETADTMLVAARAPVHCIHADAIDRDGMAIVDSPDAEGRMRKRDAGMGISDDASFNLTTGRPHAVAFQERGRTDGRNVEWQDDLAYSLNAPNGGGRRQELNIAANWKVRRLTPTECHRLQGFPDDHCAIQHRGKIAADGPQYKALGNSWAKPNGAWIIGRIAERLAA